MRFVLVHQAGMVFTMFGKIKKKYSEDERKSYEGEYMLALGRINIFLEEL